MMQRDRVFVLFWSVVFCFGVLGGGQVEAQGKKSKSQAYEKVMIQGRAFYKAGKWEESLEQFRKALKELRGRPMFQKSEVYVHIGMVLARMGKHGMALKAFEVALYQDICLELPNKEDASLNALFANAQGRVSRRGGVVGRSSSCSKSSNRSAPQGSAPTAISPWPWVALGVGALLLTGGTVLMANALSHQGQLETWKNNTSGKGYKQEDVDTTSLPLQETAGWQLPTGIGLLVGGVLAVGASIPLFLFLKAKPSAASASRMSLPQGSRRAMVRLLDLP